MNSVKSWGRHEKDQATFYEFIKEFIKELLDIIKYPVPSDLREEASLGPRGKESSVRMAGRTWCP